MLQYRTNIIHTFHQVILFQKRSDDLIFENQEINKILKITINRVSQMVM